MEENKNLVLPMCDVSGSMAFCLGSPAPIDVCVSLGIYISERNEGLFKDAFLTFSEKPKVQYLSGSFAERCKQLSKAHWEMNTNLESTFEYLLNIAKLHEIEQDKMPDTILILSDMQFDRCVKKGDDKALQMIERMYEEAGYKLPQVVFWNLNSRVNQSPVTVKDKRTCIVSGFSPSILKSVLDGSVLSPESVMLKTVFSKRYEPITI